MDLVSTDRHPFRTFIVKVASRCNLNCTYCYEYNKADQTWRDAARFMSPEIMSATADRIAEHVLDHGLRRVFVTAHGGEPTLAGPERLDRLFSTVRAAIPRSVDVRFGIQTNATLIDDGILRVLSAHRVSVGVSLDGPPAANSNRIDHAGRPTYEAAVRGITALRRFGDGSLFAGILTAVNTDVDPVSLLEHHASLSPPQIDLLQHFGTHDCPPPGIHAGSNTTPFADWMLKAFHHWTATPHLQKIRIRFFEDAMSLLLGGKASSDWLGLSPTSYVVVAIDGGIEGTDMLKIVGTLGRVLGLHKAPCGRTLGTSTLASGTGSWGG